MSDGKALKDNPQHRFLCSWKTHHFLSGRTPVRALVQPLHCPEKGSNWPAAGELSLSPSALILTTPIVLEALVRPGERGVSVCSSFRGLAPHPGAHWLLLTFAKLASANITCALLGESSLEGLGAHISLRSP